MAVENIEWVINKPDLERKIPVDSDKICIVFRNLISNAIDAIVTSGKNGGKIAITVTEDKDRRMVQAIFEDNGCGMKQKVKDRLFKEYVSIKQKSFGIGLYFSYSIIKAHQGEITFESEDGRGSKFVVELPFSQEERKEE